MHRYYLSHPTIVSIENVENLIQQNQITKNRRYLINSYVCVLNVQIPKAALRTSKPPTTPQTPTSQPPHASSTTPATPETSAPPPAAQHKPPVAAKPSLIPKVGGTTPKSSIPVSGTPPAVANKVR